MNASLKIGDRLFREAAIRLQFREINYASLGYSSSSSSGSGIGPKLANELAKTAFDIVKAGINDPVIFELVGLFESGIGADRISDMTVWVILEDLLLFSQRVTKTLSLPSIDALSGRKQPPVLCLLPKELLSLRFYN